MNDIDKLNSNSKDHLIDELLDNDIPLPDNNARKIAVNSAVSMFETKKNEPLHSNDSEPTTPLLGIINTFFHSLNNNKAFAGVAVSLACIGFFSLLPSSFQKQEIKSETLINETQYDDGFSASIASAPQSAEVPANIELQKPLNLEEIVVSGAREATVNNRASAKEDYDLAESAVRSQVTLDSAEPMLQSKSRADKIAQTNTSRIQEGDTAKSHRKEMADNALVPGLIAKQKDLSTTTENEHTNSYAIIQASLNSGDLPPPDTVKIAELLNHFAHDYPSPSSMSEPLKATMWVVDSPWSQTKKIVYIGIQGYQSASKNSSNELGSLTATIAKDLALQLAFNSELVSQYRLLSHHQLPMLSGFKAGQSLTLIYEISVNNTRQNFQNQLSAGRVGVLKMRYTLPLESHSKSIETVLSLDQTSTSEALQFSIAVASFAQKLKGHVYAHDISYSDIASLAKSNIGNDFFGRKAEFIRLIELAQSIDSAMKGGHKKGP